MTIKAEILVDGTLRVDVGNLGFTMPAPIDPEVVDIASQHLIEKMAGVSKGEIALAVARVMFEGVRE